MDRNLDGGIYGDNGGGVAVGGIIGGTWFAARSNTHMIIRSISLQFARRVIIKSVENNSAGYCT